MTAFKLQADYMSRNETASPSPYFDRKEVAAMMLQS